VPRRYPSYLQEKKRGGWPKRTSRQIPGLRLGVSSAFYGPEGFLFGSFTRASPLHIRVGEKRSLACMSRARLESPSHFMEGLDSSGVCQVQVLNKSFSVSSFQGHGQKYAFPSASAASTPECCLNQEPVPEPVQHPQLSCIFSILRQYAPIQFIYVLTVGFDSKAFRLVQTG